MESGAQTIPTNEFQPGEALRIRRFFTTPDVHPLDTVQWELRDARIGHGDKVVFEQTDVEFPTTWSQNATNIVAQKYFRGQVGSPARERSVKQMVSRVSGTIADWGRARGYFATAEDGDTFEAELTYVLLHQMVAFNSPVWFNVGFEESPQCSACFILSVDDTMDSILDWNTRGGQASSVAVRAAGINLSNDPRLDGAAEQGRHRLWAGLVHAWRRRVGRARSSRAARPDARRRWSSSTSSTPTSASSSGARPRRRRRPTRSRDAGFDMSIDWRRLHLDPVPERQQLGARERRVHATRSSHDARVLDPTARHHRGDRSETRSRRATSCARWPTRRTAAPTRACSTTRRSTHWHTTPEVGAHQRI